MEWGGEGRGAEKEVGGVGRAGVEVGEVGVEVGGAEEGGEGGGTEEGSREVAGRGWVVGVEVGGAKKSV